MNRRRGVMVIGMSGLETRERIGGSVAGQVVSATLTQRVESEPGARSAIVQSVRWNVAASAAAYFTRTLLSVILARLLTPADYGVAGMAFVFSTLIYAFADLGLGAGLVQRPNPTDEDKSTVFWASVAVGAVLTILGVVLAGPIAAFYGEPRVQPLLIALSTTFFIGALGMTPAALLTRAMRFRTFTVRSFVSAGSGGVAGVAAALSGWGPWSLVVLQVTSTLGSTILLWSACGWRPRFAFSRASLRDLGGFGIKIWGAGILDYGHRNADNLLIGRFLGAASLGAYSVAYNLMIVPLQRLILPIAEAMFPTLSRLKDDHERLSVIWLRATRAIAAVVMPATLGLFVVAPDVVEVVLGPRWRAAGPVLRILSIVAALQALPAASAKVLAALDRTHVILGNSALSFALSLPAFIVGLHWGIVGVAVAYAVINVPIQLMIFPLTARGIGLPLRLVLTNLAGVLVAAGVMCFATFVVRLVLIGEAVPALPRLGLLLVVGLSVYFVVARIAARGALADLWSMRRRDALAVETARA